MLNQKLLSQTLGGTLRDSKYHLTGNYRGFYISITQAASEYIIRINAKAPENVEPASLNEFLLRMKSQNKNILDAQALPYSIVLGVKQPALAKKIPDVINEAVEPIISYLSGNSYESGCEQCGSTEERLSCYEINGDCHYVCDGCVNEISASLQEHKQTVVAQKSLLVPGLIGALLGALLGCVLWVIIYKLGYIAGIAGAVIGLCAMKGYEIFGKVLDKKGVIGSVIIMVLAIYLANKFAWSLEAYEAFVELGEVEVSFFDVFRNIGSIISELDLSASYFGDLAIGYFLTVLSSYRQIANAFHTSTGSFNVTKMD